MLDRPYMQQINSFVNLLKLWFDLFYNHYIKLSLVHLPVYLLLPITNENPCIIR